MIDTLVVDDDPVVAAVIRRFVEQAPGFRVVGVASSGAQARSAVRELNPRLVLLDLRLPDADGLALATEFRRNRYEVDIVVITGLRDLRAVREAMQGGVLHYLLKPVRLDSLHELLARFRVLDQRLAARHVPDQNEVDRLFRVLHDRTTGGLPKGMTTHTLKTVLEAVTVLEDCSAQQVAEQAGISRPTAGRYLEHLARTGRVHVWLTHGARGRPQHRYALGDRG